MVAITMLKIGAAMMAHTTTRSSVTPIKPDRTIVTKKDQPGKATHTR